MKYLLDHGIKAGKVEHYNTFAQKRFDFLGIIDVLALYKDRGVCGIQVCGEDVQPHIVKMREERHENTVDWLTTPNTVLEIWSWRKVKLKRGGKLMVWRPRIIPVTLDDLQE